jgi:hypothetical protein
MTFQSESPKARGGWAFLGASIDVGTIRELDRIRGEVPRSRLVERALKQFLEREKITTPTTTAFGERNNQNI